MASILWNDGIKTENLFEIVKKKDTNPAEMLQLSTSHPSPSLLLPALQVNPPEHLSRTATDGDSRGKVGLLSAHLDAERALVPRTTRRVKTHTPQAKRGTMSNRGATPPPVTLLVVDTAAVPVLVLAIGRGTVAVVAIRMTSPERGALTDRVATVRTRMSASKEVAGVGVVKSEDIETETRTEIRTETRIRTETETETKTEVKTETSTERGGKAKMGESGLIDVPRINTETEIRTEIRTDPKTKTEIGEEAVVTATLLR
jgi:hypothetical protein